MLLQRPKFSFLTIVFIALAFMVPLLAGLQYNWLGQVSQGQRERMQANLRAGAIQFSRDFDREIASAYLSFKIDSASGPDQARETYIQRYNYWLNTSPYPELVENIFWVDSDKNGGARLARLDQQTKQFKPAEWPTELEQIHQQFAKQYQTTGVEVGTMLMNSPPPINDEIPALIFPVLVVEATKSEQAIHPMPQLANVIVKLNLDFIKNTFIPMLANRHFYSDDKPDYDLAIVSRDDPKKVIYNTGSAFSDGAISHSDASIGLFGIRLDDILSLSVKSSSLHQSVDGKQSQLRSFAVRVPNTNERQSDVEPSDASSGRWQLALRHHIGSLDAAVKQLRYKNLAISFGVLLVLAASITMMLVAVYRSQQLAKQQLDFIAGITHDLRTPLAVICSAGDNLTDGVINTPDRIKQYGTLIRNEGYKLAEMVEQVLEFAGINSYRKAYRLQQESVESLVEGGLSSLHSLLSQGGFRVEKEIQPDLPSVMVDKTAMMRSIQNLISNAMKYSGQSRLIKIKARRAQCDRGEEILITVEDNGIGIAQSEIPHIFNSFYRGREAMNRQIRGTGIGLSLVKRLTESQGGRVSVKSTVGRGSCFTIHLPVMTHANTLIEEAKVIA